MNNFAFHVPTKVYFGKGQVSGRPHMIVMLEEFIQYALEKKAWIAPFREVLKRTEF